MLSDTDHFIQNTVSVTEDTKQRISAVLVYFGRIRPTDRLDDPKSFAVRYLAADPDAAGVNQYGSPQIKKIFSRWFQAASLGACRIWQMRCSRPIAIHRACWSLNWMRRQTCAPDRYSVPTPGLFRMSTEAMR